MNLSELIRHHKGDRTYEQLAAATDGKLTAQRLQQIATAPHSQFLKPASVKALAAALHVKQLDVVLASAESLGLDVQTETPELAQVLASLATDLDGEEVEALVRLVRTFKRERGEGHGDSPAATTDPGSGSGPNPGLRLVEDADDVGRGDVDPTAIAPLIERYLGQAEGDIDDARRLLLHDGAAVAGVSEATWMAVLTDHLNATPDDFDPSVDATPHDADLPNPIRGRNPGKAARKGDPAPD